MSIATGWRAVQHTVQWAERTFAGLKFRFTVICPFGLPLLEMTGGSSKMAQNNRGQARQGQQCTCEHNELTQVPPTRAAFDGPP